jgi:hypothetical protein
MKSKLLLTFSFVLALALLMASCSTPTPTPTAAPEEPEAPAPEPTAFEPDYLGDPECLQQARAIDGALIWQPVKWKSLHPLAPAFSCG